jgi:hypothetical protein
MMQSLNCHTWKSGLQKVKEDEQQRQQLNLAVVCQQGRWILNRIDLVCPH